MLIGASAFVYIGVLYPFASTPPHLNKRFIVTDHGYGFDFILQNYQDNLVFLTTIYLLEIETTLMDFLYLSALITKITLQSKAINYKCRNMLHYNP